MEFHRIAFGATILDGQFPLTFSWLAEELTGGIPDSTIRLQVEQTDVLPEWN